MSCPRLWLLVAIGSLAALTGCSRPTLPDQDIVQPAPEPAATEPAPTTPADAPAADAGPTVTIDQPAAGDSPAAGAELPLELSVEAAPGTVTGLLIWVDAGPPLREAWPEGQQGPLTVTLPGLPAGLHLLRVAAVEESGLSLTPGAMAVRQVQVGTGGAPAPGDPAGPLLTVGEPFDQVSPGEGGALAFEVRVDGATLAETGVQLKWQVDDGSPAAMWEFPPPEPLALGPFEPGSHKLLVWLEGADGKPVENGSLTRVERTFQVAKVDAAG